MKSAVVLLPLLAGVALPALAHQENARVISSVPMVTQVAIPQQNCYQQPVVTSQSSGAGAVIGGLAGGLLGNTIGKGGGRGAATVLGAVGGAMVGDNLERRPTVQNATNCTTQTMYEERTTGYNVTYEYAGRQYSTQTATDPGQWIQIEVGPVAAQSAPVQSAPVTSTTTMTSVQPGVVVSSTPVYTQPVYSQPVYAPAPVYAAPVYSAPYYASPYYAPPVSLNFGYVYHGGRWR